MDFRNVHHSWRYLLVILNVSLFSFSGMAFAETGDVDVQSEASIINLKYAANNEVVFTPRQLKWTAINADGKVVRTGRASGGQSYCPDIHRSCRTPTGTYSVISKSGAGCHSSRYPVGKGGAPMPYCMFFSRYYAIHGSYEVPHRNASHGCIRVTPKDAHWLSDHFVHIGTKIVVKPY